MDATKQRQRRQARHDRRSTRSTVPHGVYAATRTEGRALFDHQARKLLGIPGDEFLRRWDDGEYRDIADAGDGRKVRRLVMLMPFVRRTTG